MTKNNNLVRLGDLCDSISGLWTGKKPPFEKATVIRNTNFTKDCKLDLSNIAVLDVETKQLQSRRLMPGDLIVEKSGGGPNQAVGRVVHFNESAGSYSLSNFTSALRIKNSSEAIPKYLQHFLYYQYISGVTETMQSNSTGIRNLNIHQFLDIEVPLPSIKKQLEIVEKLDSAFAEVDLIETSVQKEINYVNDLYQSLIDSKFEDLSETAQTHRLEDFCTKIQDGSHFSPKVQLTEPRDGWFPYLTSKNVRNNYVDLKGVTYIDSEFHQGIFQRCNPEYGDLLLTKDGVNTGNVTLNTLTFPFSLLSSVCIIKVKKSQMDATYLKFYLQSSKGNKNILGDMTGAAIKRIILKTIKNLSIPIVDIQTQTELGELLESNLLSIDEYKRGLAKKISLIRSLRQSLLSSTFTQEEAVG